VRTIRRTRADALVASCFVAAAVLVLIRVWADPDGRTLADGGQDPYQWESFLDVMAHAVVHGHNPLYTDLLNHPDGANLLANTTVAGLSVPLTPVTLMFGPATTYLLLLTLGMAGTAFAWYHVFSRDLVASRSAAVTGGAFCGFAPPVVSHANAHPNFVVLFVLPFIARQVFALGLLTAYQVALGGEILLLFATAIAVYLASWAIVRRSAVKPALRTMLPGGGIAVGVFLVTGGPLMWWQFYGPQSYTSLGHGVTGQDLLALVSFATRTLAGAAGDAGSLAMNATEQNAFLGWPLLCVLVGVVLWLRGEQHVRVLAATAGVMCLLSLGDHITVAHHDTGIPGPWRLLAKLPLYESVISSRAVLAALPAIGALLALAVDRLVPLLRYTGGDARRAVVGALAVVLGALLAIVPTPLAATDSPAVPAFITSGVWREYVRPGRTLVPVPVPSPYDATATRWQTAAGAQFALPEGYVLVPWANRQGGYGTFPRATSQLLGKVAGGETVPVGDRQRADAESDLRYWDADAVVLPDAAPHRAMLRHTLDELLGPGTRVEDVWVWRAP